MARSVIPSIFGGVPAARQGDPFFALQQQFNRLFEDVFRGSWLPATGAFGETATVPRLNISENDKEFRIEAELPGVSEDDVEVTLNEDVLTIRGEKKAERTEREENYHVVERSYGSFARSIRLPFAVNPDNISASCRNGVLAITVPKAAVQAKAHRIEIAKGEATPEPKNGGQAGQTTH